MDLVDKFYLLSFDSRQHSPCVSIHYIEFLGAFQNITIIYIKFLKIIESNK